MELLLISPKCFSINLLNGKSCLFWTNLVQQYLFKINSQQTISYLLLIKITDFLFQTAYKPEKLTPTQCAIDSAGALDLDLPPHPKVYKTTYLRNDKSARGKSGVEGNQEAMAEICVLSVMEYRMAQLCFSPQPEVPRAHRLELSLGTLNLRTTLPFCLNSSPFRPWRE